jgi:hypothetical protein
MSLVPEQAFLLRRPIIFLPPITEALTQSFIMILVSEIGTPLAIYRSPFTVLIVVLDIQATRPF